MRSAGVALGLAVAALSVPAGLRAEDGPDSAAAAHGETTYRRYCVTCHGAEGRGDGPIAKDLRSEPTDLSQLAAANDGEFAFDDVVKAIDGRKTVRSHGTADMPAWGDAFQNTDGTGADSVEEAVAQVAHFVWTLQRPKKN